MGTLTITEILKLLKALKDVKQQKKKKKNKRRRQFYNNNIKSTSDHMIGTIIKNNDNLGNVITGEHLRKIQDNNDLKMKLLSSEINNNNQSEIKNLNNNLNEMKYKAAFYLSNQQNNLNQINRFLSRQNNFYKSDDNIDVTNNNPDEAFHIEANLSEQEARPFYTQSERVSPSNLSNDNNIFEEEEKEEEKKVEEEKEEEEKVEEEEEKVEETNNDIVEEEDTTNDGVIEDVSNNEMNNLLNKYLSNKEFKSEYDANYLKIDGSYRENTPKRNDGNTNKRLEKKEREEIISFLEHFGKKDAARRMANTTTKYAAFKILHENFNT